MRRWGTDTAKAGEGNDLGNTLELKRFAVAVHHFGSSVDAYSIARCNTTTLLPTRTSAACPLTRLPS
eukprot:7032844-Karenia_brevis.AAC.1